MKKSLRLLSILLSLCLLLAVVPLGTFAVSAATSGSCGTNLTWSYDTSTYTLTISGTGAMTNYSFSSSVPWYSYRFSIKNVNIGNGVTSIGDCAFSGCTGLTSVTIPDSVTTIGSYAFYDCTGLTSVTIPDSVTTIGNEAFYGCNNLKYNQYDNAKYLGNDTNPYLYLAKATSTNITSCAIHENTKFIGDNAFHGCTGLTSVTIPDSVTTIGSAAFSGCTGLTSITIPNSVTAIGDYAFEDCTGLKSVTIPNSVTTIGSQAFYGCTGLTSVTIPDSVTAIGSAAFYGCNNLQYNQYDNAKYLGNATNPYLYLTEATLTNITSCAIHENTKIIGSFAFYRCTGLTSVTIPNSVITIGGSAFSGCTGLTSVTIPNSVTTIGSQAFYGCTGLTSITIPDSVTTIGDDAFYGCNNLQYNQYDNAKYLGNDTNPYLYLAKATSTNITSCAIHENTKFIGDNAFDGCKGLTSVTIPNSVTTIGDSAFAWCSGLTSVTIGDSVTSIGSYAFYGCTGLKKVFYLGSQTDWQKISIGSNNNPLTNATRVYNATVCDINGHSYGSWIAETPATCTADGVKAHHECNVCHKYFDDSQNEIADLTIPAFGHQLPSSFEIVNDSNCPFSLNDSVYTSTNHNHGSTSTFTITASSFGTLQLQYSVSSESGYDNLIIAKNGSTLKSVSGSVSWTDLSVPMVNGDKVTIKYSKDSSQSSGSDCGYFRIIDSNEMVSSVCEGVYCTVCGEELISPTGHSYGNWIDEVPMFCTINGIVGHYECSTCHKYFDSDKNVITDLVIPAHHTETVLKTTAPTCTAQGYDIVKCSVCGLRYNTNYTAALGHNYGDWMVTKKATCTENGTETRYCSRCDATQTRTIIHSGHDRYQRVGTVIATCVRDGGILYQCSVCGETYLDVTVPALGHFFDDGVCLDCGLHESDVPFDIDLDCAITANDIVSAKQILLGFGNTKCDPNGDGVTDIRDLVRLKKRLAG